MTATGCLVNTKLRYVPGGLLEGLTIIEVASGYCRPTSLFREARRGASPQCGDGLHGVRRQDETHADDEQRRSDLNPADPAAAQPGEDELPHARGDNAHDDQNGCKPRLKTTTVISPTTSLPSAIAASRMAKAPGSGRSPPAIPNPSKMARRGLGARHRLDVVRVDHTPAVAVEIGGRGADEDARDRTRRSPRHGGGGAVSPGRERLLGRSPRLPGCGPLTAGATEFSASEQPIAMTSTPVPTAR